MKMTDMTRSIRICVLLLVAAATPSWSAGAVPAAAQDKPVTAVRVGGSPADASFRNSMQKSGADFRAARSACAAGAKAGRAACIEEARDNLKRDRAAAQAAHQIAK
ncbi:MAG: hypothetical protein ABI281_13150 [Caldimonas sp.]